ACRRTDMTRHAGPFVAAMRSRAATSRVSRPWVAILGIPLVGALGCAPAQSGAIDTRTPPAADELRPAVRSDDPSGAREALALMSDRWRQQWFNTALVRLEVTLFGLGAPAPGEWALTIRVPGRARVDYLPLESNSGVLYTRGMVYGFQEGERAAAEERTDLAMVALNDLPGLDPDSALVVLAAARVDTSLFRAADDSGARIWIIGGGTNDSLRSEVWIDAERRLVRRAVDVRPIGQRTVTNEARV